jgi:protein SCO1/2
MRGRLRFRWLLVGFLLCGCGPRGHQYPLNGQVLAVGSDKSELTVKHDNIQGFMPAMTMAYRVPDARELSGLQPGDLITATLVVPNGAVPFLTGIRRTGHAAVAANAPLPHVMDVLQPGDAVPNDELRDQNGAARRLSEWNGRALAVTFIYTRCPLPDFCPLIDRRFADAQRELAKDPSLRDAVHLVSVSFDPSHDTPPVLAAHARSLDADPAVWTFLTGSPAAIASFASRFGVSTMEEQETATIVHNLRTAIVDARGRLVTVYSGNDWSTSTLLNDLRDASRR